MSRHTLSRPPPSSLLVELVLIKVRNAYSDMHRVPAERWDVDLNDAGVALLTARAALARAKERLEREEEETP